MALEVLESRPKGLLQQVALLFHGRGSDEEDLFDLSGIFGPNTRVLSVRAPFAFGPGFAWYGMDGHGEANREQLQQSIRMLDQLVDQVSEGGPVILLGFSQGGLMACATAAHRQARGLKAAISLSAPPMPLPPEGEPLKDFPVFWGHGTEDPVVPWPRGQRTLEIVRSLGARVTAKRYAAGHTITEQEIDDLLEWLERI